MLRAALLLWCFSLSAPLRAATVVIFTDGSGGAPAGTVAVEPFEDQVAGSMLGTKSLVYDKNVSGHSARPATAPVPEPATWALMVGGLGMVGFGLRRRARTEAPAAV